MIEMFHLGSQRSDVGFRLVELSSSERGLRTVRTVSADLDAFPLIAVGVWVATVTKRGNYRHKKARTERSDMTTRAQSHEKGRGEAMDLNTRFA